MVAAADVEHLDGLAGCGLERCRPGDRRLDDVAPVADTENHAGYVHVDAEDAFDGQRGHLRTQSLEIAGLVEHDAEPRWETGHAQPHAPHAIPTPGRREPLELFDRIAEHRV